MHFSINVFYLPEDSEDLEEDQEEDGEDVKEDREDIEEEIEDKEDADASDDMEGAAKNDENKEIENPYITLHTKKRKLDSQGL